MTPLDAMKQALGHLKFNADATSKQVRDNLRTAITELESAEPSAYIWTNNKGWEMYASIPHDEYTNIPLFLHPSQSRDFIIEECAAVCEEVHSRYPTDIFPEGQSVTAQSAKMARITANNCALEIRALKGK